MQRFTIAALALACSTSAFAGGIIKAVPVPTEGQTVRYERGTPTIEDDSAVAGVRVMPVAELDHRSMQFEIAVFNKSKEAFNVGVENVSFAHNDTQLAVFTVDELEEKAKSRAMWSQIGDAMLAGAAAAAQNNNTTVKTYAPDRAEGHAFRSSGSMPGSPIISQA